jgi:hypothetical protein
MELLGIMVYMRGLKPLNNPHRENPSTHVGYVGYYDIFHSRNVSHDFINDHVMKSWD